jgi:hypothetical protein
MIDLSIEQYIPRSGRVMRDDGSVVNEANAINDDGIKRVQLSGNVLEEMYNETDAVAGVLTFAEGFKSVEIMNMDEVNTGYFEVNGIVITVPKSTPYKTDVGGIPDNKVTVTGSTSYTVSRCI